MSDGAGKCRLNRGFAPRPYRLVSARPDRISIVRSPRAQNPPTPSRLPVAAPSTRTSTALRGSPTSVHRLRGPGCVGSVLRRGRRTVALLVFPIATDGLRSSMASTCPCRTARSAERGGRGDAKGSADLVDGDALGAIGGAVAPGGFVGRRAQSPPQPDEALREGKPLARIRDLFAVSRRVSVRVSRSHAERRLTLQSVLGRWARADASKPTWTAGGAFW